LEALLTNEVLSDAVPLDRGVKVTVNKVLWPAAKVSGNETPLTLNSQVLVETEATVTLAPLALSEASALSHDNAAEVEYGRRHRQLARGRTRPCQRDGQRGIGRIRDDRDAPAGAGG
jgi:hypothetical protein